MDSVADTFFTFGFHVVEEFMLNPIIFVGGYKHLSNLTDMVMIKSQVSIKEISIITPSHESTVEYQAVFILKRAM